MTKMEERVQEVIQDVPDVDGGQNANKSEQFKILKEEHSESEEEKDLQDVFDGNDDDAPAGDTEEEDFKKRQKMHER